MAVTQELRRGPPDRTSAWIELISHLPLLEEQAPVLAIANIYIQRKVMPASSVGDPLHLALASFYRCDYLLTWNYRHLANPNKFEHIRHVNSRLKLFVPRIVTPSDLLGDER